jgi:hypothetical protein|tara:strand:+ start:1119 stop:1298 length:180 start_codon:yes stop_codon:yes gene_type:complete
MLKIISMKIKNMTREQLEFHILYWDDKLKNPAWVVKQKSFHLGVIVVHLAKLRKELAKR